MENTKENLIKRIYRAIEVMKNTQNFYKEANISYPKTADFDQLAYEEIAYAICEIEKDLLIFADKRITDVETYHLYPNHNFIVNDEQLVSNEVNVDKDLPSLLKHVRLRVNV